MKAAVRSRLEKLERVNDSTGRLFVVEAPDAEPAEIQADVSRALAEAGIERRPADKIVILLRFVGSLKQARMFKQRMERA
jgi:hypothetical protein